MEEGTQGQEEGRRPSSDQGGRARVDLQEAGPASVWSVRAPAGPGKRPECALGGQLPLRKQLAPVGKNAARIRASLFSIRASRR